MTLFSNVHKPRINSRDSKLSWLTTAASVMVLLCSVGFLYGFGILYNAFLEEYQDSREKTAWVGSIPLSMMCTLAPIASWILNRYSLCLCTAVTAIPIGLCLFLTSYARNVNETIAIFSVPFGFSASMMVMISNKSLQVYFDKRLSTAMGLMTGGSAICQVGFTYSIIMLLNSYGLEKTLRILGCIMALICIAASQLYLPTSYDPNPLHSISPSKRGVRFYLNLLRKKQFSILAFATFVASLAYGVSSVHQVQLAIEYGVEEKIARQFPVFWAISSSLGRVCCGFVADSKAFRLATFYCLVLVLNGTIAIVGSFSSSPTHLIMYIWLFAFTDGCLQVCCMSMVRETLELDTLSEGIALIFSVDAVSVMLGPPFLGFIVDQTNDYRAYFFVAGVPAILSAIIAFPLRFMSTSEDAKAIITEQMCSDKGFDCDPINADCGKDEQQLRILYETSV